MTLALLRKELRSLAPFLGLILFFIALDWSFVFLAEFPDQFALSRLLDYRSEGPPLLFVLAFALSAGLLVRERDEGTLAFLDALPVSRVRVFLCKAALALATLWLIPLSDYVQLTLLHAWSRTSLETYPQWTNLVTAGLLEAVECVVFLGVGLALSFLRRFALLALGLILVTYMLLRELDLPYLQLLNIFTLSTPVFHGQRWVVPWSKLFVQLALGATGFAVALAGFLALGDPGQRLAATLKRRRVLTILGGGSTALAVLVWLGLMVYWVESSSEEDSVKVRYEGWATARATSARYRFIYPENQQAFVAKFIDQADAVEKQVREFLQAEPINRIEADLTSSAPHTLGVAHWKKVNLDLAAAGEDLNRLVAWLAHETTHVYISHESQNRVDDEFNSTRFFHEGLASYVEYRFFQTPAQRNTLRRVAAVLRARDEVRMEELVDDAALARQRDPESVYPLGELFVAALVRRYGEAAPGRILRAFARPDAPKDLKGFALWQNIFQACGYDWSEGVDTFFAELDAVVAEQRDFIDPLPRLRGAVQRDDSWLGVIPDYRSTTLGTVVCRFRPDANTPMWLYEYGQPRGDQGFWVEGSRYTEASFWYQLGWQAPGASQPIFEKWVEVPR
jgi:ABC-type transport system involved in multi-copper enzyme maturation permease subunit